ncbi:hypothetical protein [Streptomyces formicae]|uniref:Uncharacterized protein n=1 Tax=Streptomyces formicae TaxID=1616117 RepID=A0ABY3WTD4_9ACTN|nr:hypothetical protein [Streptomyces formicae]UNM13043.1 hypothetical protein J4032_17400 [Streptomyces formicae]
MSEFSHDPEAAAIYGFLRSRESPEVVGAVPAPASVSRRRQAPATAIDIARAEGLELGLESTQASVETFVFDLATTTLGCRRGEARVLARAWAKAGYAGQGEVFDWAESVGLRNLHVVQQLRSHGITPDMLETCIDGTAARRRLRNGERVGGIIGALLAATR